MLDIKRTLINLLEKFGFYLAGYKEDGECVYIKDRNNIDISNPHKSFPFLPASFGYGGIIPINAQFHDQLFPYSELKNVQFIQSAMENVAGNGVTKVYIATPSGTPQYYKGEPVVFYRIATEHKQYRSVVSSYGRIIKCVQVRTPNGPLMKYDDYRDLVGNKSIFDESTLSRLYYSNRNVFVLELVYCGFFGAGNNVNYKALKDEGLFEDYPYQIRYTSQEYKRILEMGGINVQTAFID